MQNTTDARAERSVFLIAIGGTALIGVLALALSILLDAPFSAQFSWTARDGFIGFAAVSPPALFLWWFSETKNAYLVRFRRSQIEFFANVGFEFTIGRILAMAIAAGIAEELLFRGVLQTWIASFAPLAVAIIAPNILFGLLHMRTALYAVIAGLVGAYLGVLFALTDNLLTPMIAHGLYDLVALEYTRRAIRALREASMAR